MNEDKKLQFLEELTTLLKGQVTPKSKETLEGEAFCESLKLHITQLYEQTHRLDLFSDEFNYSEFVASNIDFPLDRLKEQIEKTWLKDKLTIGFMGHFATGKTTALNLLFDESFQVHQHENTAIATYLTYGSKQNVVTIVDRAGQSQELTLDQCSILDYSKGIMGFPFARIFNYMVKENSAKLLEDITIIDTPGLFSKKTDHSAPTMNVISSCDTVFWFLNITNSLRDDDIRVMKESLQGKPVYIVFSFVDALGTTQSQVDSSIKSIVANLKEKQIDYKGYLMLGGKAETQSRFKREALNLLKKMSDEYEVYSPGGHISASIDFLENFLVQCQANHTKQIGKLDKETDDLLDAYRASSRSFITECNNCTSRFNNMVDTFNTRCAGAMFCGGAEDALRNNINSISNSLNGMVRAYNNMNEEKLVDFGKGVARMQLYQYNLDKISEILSEVKKLKEYLQ
ncbi:MAG: dynamin family protein [Bacteroidales bacterium]|nr:dynamin family protein [Bacteroidales bacterium]